MLLTGTAASGTADKLKGREREEGTLRDEEK